jgi:glutamate synthase (ferredoxin)
LDGIREEIITDVSLQLVEILTSLTLTQNIARKKIQNPVISKEDLDKIRNIDHPDFKSASISTLYEIEKEQMD